MIRHVLLPPLAALTICAFGVAATAAQGGSPETIVMERMQHWAADHEAMLDAKLAGLKAGLKLTPDQEKLWPPFEAAVRDAAKMRMERMKAMMQRLQTMQDTKEQKQDANEKDMAQAGQAVSPVDRLETLAKHMSERGAALEKVVDAAKPLYASLDDTQKRLFGLLGERVLMMGHGHPGMGMMGGMGTTGGMGMMGREPGIMNMMGSQSNDDEDNSDDE